MAHAAATNLAPASAGKSKVGKTLGIVAWTALVAIAVAFILKDVFHYYLNYNAAAFNPYWPRRGGLLLHITGGMVALLTAPWQFFTGLTGRRMNVHRYTGRIFLGGVTAGVIGATYLAFTTTFGWFRVFSDYGPTSHLKPPGDLAVTLAWACWVVPLCINEARVQLKRIRTAKPARA